MVQLKCSIKANHAIWFGGFNSCMVQLKCMKTKSEQEIVFRFNSCMVQLKSVTNIGFSV